MYKNVEIVFRIPKAKSGSITIKIRQPLFWTDPYLPDLLFTLGFNNLLFTLGLKLIHFQELVIIKPPLVTVP